MIPLKLLRRTDVRPYMTYALVLVNILVFIWEVFLPDANVNRVFMDISITTCQVATQFFHPKTWLDILRSMFLHGGFAHLFGNMLFLVVFAPSLEEYFGHSRFLGFYLLSGVAAVLIHAGVEAATRSLGCELPYMTAGNVPLVGASGAISGLLGGFILMFPGTKVRTLIPIFGGIGPVGNISAFLSIGYWFALQLFSGFAAIAPSGAISNVAYWAHIGGFLFGLIAVFLATTIVPPPPQNLTES
ncbi:MAG: rhomboid family intramembrane serine protease [Phototrophicaceae bacterium]|jgi:membrane associated rhomboid family serine protease